MTKHILALLVITLSTGCVGLIHSVRLPIATCVVNADTHKPVENAQVELQWRSGFQGYYWGKTVFSKTDASGHVVFKSKDVPPVAEVGYRISDKPLTEVFVSRFIVRANGYDTLALESPNQIPIIELQPQQ